MSQSFQSLPDRCRRCGNHIGLIAISISLLLGAFKFFIGYKSGSHALMTNAFYSLQDVISASFVFLGTRYARRPANQNYPYGHGKLEFITSTIISVGIIAGVVVMIFVSGKNVLEGPQRPNLYGFWGALVAMVATYILSRFIRCAGQRHKSPALLSSYQHIHADTISAGCVAIGILVSFMGFHHLDSLIAIFEAIHIIKTSIEIFSDGYKGLMDSALPVKEERLIRKVINTWPEVKKVVSLKTRALGRNGQIDVVLALDGQYNMSDVERLKSGIRAELAKRLDSQCLVQFSIAPYGEEAESERRTSHRITKVLSGYYRSFIKTHKLTQGEASIKLALEFLPDIPVASAREVSRRIRQNIKEEFPNHQVLVTHIV